MTDGTHRLDRHPAALDAGTVGIDESDVAARSASGADLARQLLFDPTLPARGDWLPLFLGDDALTLQRLLALDVDAIAADLLAAGPLTAPPLRHVRALVEPLQPWATGAMTALPPPALPDALVALIGRIHAQATDIAAIGAAPPQPAADRRRRAFAELASLVKRLQELARDALAASLVSGRHAPAPSLLLAFQQLYELPRQHLNRFAARHADFYLREVLRAEPQPAPADWAHVICQRTPRFDGETLIARGTVFPAGKDAAGNPVEFAADDDLLVTDARVVALHTLRLERDPLVAPEYPFDYVCRARATTLPAEPGAAGPTGPTGAPAGRRWWPVFGGSSERSGGDGAVAAQIGFALASPLLHLCEGEREIRLDIVFTDADAVADLVARLREGPGPGRAGLAAYRADLGRLFTRWLFDAREWFAPADDSPPTLADLDAIRAQVALHGADLGMDDESSGIGDPQALYVSARADGRAPDAVPNRAVIFDRVMRSAFDIELSCADGWFRAAPAITPLAPDAHGAPRLGFTLGVRLGPQAPAIVGCDALLHDGLDADAPLLRARLRDDSRMYALSLLDGLRMATLRIETSVSGLRQVQLSNQYGALDATRPFAPFGPLPTLGSWLVVGAPEIARKPVVALTLRFAWSGLPREEGGFGSYYAGYRPAVDSADFTARFAVLHDGIWRADGTQLLFDADAASGILRAQRRLDVDRNVLSDHFRAGDPAARYDLTSRNGFIRLELTGPAQAFGHALYPRMLTEAVTVGAKRKLAKVALPEAPYTPVIEGLALDYRAEALCSFSTSARDSEPAPLRFFHLHPFGWHEVHSAARGGHPFLLPKVGEDGNLYIGLEASELQGSLSLLFEMREEAARGRAEQPPVVSWACLVDDRWETLSAARVLLDTTRGFLGTGIVKLDLPGAGRNNRVMPAGRFWLRASVRSELPGFGAFAGLYAVHAQALRLTRLAAPEPALGALPAGALAKPARPIPGLASALQIGASFGFAPAEDRAQFETRLSERLRHKQRAVTPWDYERLVLERFPDVLKVKCFTHCALNDAPATPGRPRPPDLVEKPGHVLLVLLPAARGMDDIADLGGPRLNSIALRRITDELQALASPAVRLRVINARYEHIQVRCALRIRAGHQPGLALRAIDRAITDFLSPWRDGGLQARFGWQLDLDEVETRIRAIDLVEDIAGLSLLHFTEYANANGTIGYQLRDTAVAAPDAAPDAARLLTVHAQSPCSIAIPMDHHLLEPYDARPSAGRPTPTGIAGLGVGATFIVGANPPPPIRNDTP